MSITQPADPTDTDGYARGSLTGTTYDPVTVRAYASGQLLDDSVVLYFEPVHTYSTWLDPQAQTTAVGGVASFDVHVSNEGYRPDDYGLELEGLTGLSTSLAHCSSSVMGTPGRAPERHWKMRWRSR